MSYRIIRAGHEHFPELLNLIGAYQKFYGQTPDPEANRDFFGTLLDDERRGVQLVALDDQDTPIGFATLYWIPTSTRATYSALLNDLYVRPEHRGGRSGGVGHALLEAAFAEAGRRGFPDVHWETADDNYTAQALYKRVVEAVPGTHTTTWLHYSYPTDVTAGDGSRHQ